MGCWTLKSVTIGGMPIYMNQTLESHQTEDEIYVLSPRQAPLIRGDDSGVEVLAKLLHDID